mgnify:CR=1 FL=1
MKILPRAFLLSVVASFLVSCASYYLFVFLCNRFAPFLLPFVFITTVLISVILFYLSAVHYRNFFAELRNDKLIIYKGFIIKRKIVLDLRFVVSAKNVSTPLMRLLKISNLLLLSEGSLCILPLIQAEDSERLYKTILTICLKGNFRVREKSLSGFFANNSGASDNSLIQFFKTRLIFFGV